MSTVKRKICLPLKDRVELIKTAEKSPRKGVRALARDFGISKTAVSDTLKRKAEYLEAFEKNDNPERKRVKFTNNDGAFEKIDKSVYDWFKKARSINASVSGPILQVMALYYANEFGISTKDFKASNGWLMRFKERHQISSTGLSSEKGNVATLSVDDWKSCLPKLLDGYTHENIFNMDETGLFFRTLPDQSSVKKGESRAGCKVNKDRITVSLCVNATGDFEQPLIIGHSENPHCFKNIKKERLPVKYCSNSKAWMTGKLFEEWLLSFNRRMNFQKRKVVLLLDNAPCHMVPLKLTNVTLLFLPPKCTSLQPLDQGIIKTMKLYYRKRLMNAVYSKIDEFGDASQLAKSVTLLDAIYWVSAAVKEVKKSTVQKCFAFCGVRHSEISKAVNDDDCEDDLALAHFLEEAKEKLSFDITVEEYQKIDDNCPATESLEPGWEARIAEELKNPSPAEDPDEEPLQSLDCSESSASKFAISTYSQALKCTFDLKMFALDKGDDKMLECITHIEETMSSSKMVENKQSKFRKKRKAQSRLL